MMLFSVFIFTGALFNLTKSALGRLPMALAASTRKSYSAMFRTFLAFLVFCQLQFHQVNVNVLLAFLECLVVNNVRHSQLLNYMSAIKTMSSAYDLSLPDINHPKLAMYLKSIQKSSPFHVKLHHIIDIPFLSSIVQKCDLTYLGFVFKACYLTAFFGFFRLSNLVPHTIAQFSVLKHLTRGDVFFDNKFVTILLKWSNCKMQVTFPSIMPKLAMRLS